MNQIDGLVRDTLDSVLDDDKIAEYLSNKLLTQINKTQNSDNGIKSIRDGTKTIKRFYDSLNEDKNSILNDPRTLKNILGDNDYSPLIQENGSKQEFAAGVKDFLLKYIKFANISSSLDETLDSKYEQIGALDKVNEKQPMKAGWLLFKNFGLKGLTNKEAYLRTIADVMETKNLSLEQAKDEIPNLVSQIEKNSRKLDNKEYTAGTQSYRMREIGEWFDANKVGLAAGVAALAIAAGGMFAMPKLFYSDNAHDAKAYVIEADAKLKEANNLLESADAMIAEQNKKLETVKKEASKVDLADKYLSQFTGMPYAPAHDELGEVRTKFGFNSSEYNAAAEAFEDAFGIKPNF